MGDRCAACPVAEGATARGGTPFPLWTALWLAGALLCAAYYAAAYIRCRRRFRESLPVGCPYVQAWQGHCRLRRRVSIRQSGYVDAPLTYGIIPLVWLMLSLANRDMELCCDEAVVRRFGADSRPAYARTLIAMEEHRSGLGPFASSFSRNAIEERIKAIMKMRKRSLAAVRERGLCHLGGRKAAPSPGDGRRVHPGGAGPAGLPVV